MAREADPIAGSDQTRRTRLKLTLAYQGQPFRGWQSQAGGNTVQDHLERALATICKQPVTVHGAGRTDAGVHALAQVAHADVPCRSPLDWVAAINAHLPREIRVLKCARAAAAFHARFSARGKIYTYRIWNAPVQSPFELGRSWHLPALLDTRALRDAAVLVVGTHDFAAFAANRGKPETNSVRTIHELAVRQKGPLITLIFRGDGFLYKMVRLLTGALMRVAQGRASREWIEALLEQSNAASPREKCAFTAPAEGLYLTRVLY